MIGLQALIAAVTRSLGKLLNTAFGWATVLLFGKVAQDRQIYLSLITFGSILWLAAALGTVFPRVGAFLLTFVTLPAWIDIAWVRLAMAATIVMAPLAVGLASVLMLAPQQRPTDRPSQLRLVLKGFPYTIGLAATLVMLLVFAPMLKLRNVLRRWTDRHVAVIVESRDYAAVVGDVQAALQAGGIRTVRRQAPWLLRVPTSVLTWFARDQTQMLSPRQLTVLTSSRMDVLLHPSDLVISGRELDAAHAQAVLSEQLTFTDAYLTWTKESNEIEDRLREIWRQRDDVDLPLNRLWERLARVERAIKSLKVPYEEWEVLFRQVTLIKLRVLEAHAPATLASYDSRLSSGTITDWLSLLTAGKRFLERVLAERSKRSEEEGADRVPTGRIHSGARG